MRLGILASHGGTNLQALLDACADGRIPGVVAVVISNNSTSGALERARAAGIPGVHRSGLTNPDDLDEAIEGDLRAHGAELICLAGYMKKLGPRTRAAFRNRVLNVHPALLPRHGGRGMFGERVHRAVLEAGDTETGVSIHLVDEGYDTGPVVAQRGGVQVRPDDTAETLAARVLAVEHDLYVETVAAIAAGRLDLDALAGTRR